MYICLYVPLNGLPFLLWSGHTGPLSTTALSVCFCVFLCVFVSVPTHHYTSTQAWVKVDTASLSFPAVLLCAPSASLNDQPTSTTLVVQGFPILLVG